MDVHQLTILPGRTVWTLRDEARPRAGEGADAPPWWEVADTPPAPAAPTTRSRRAGGRPALVATTAGLVLMTAVAGVAFLAGLRWFVVETPSMGPAAPVGALVVTAPVREALRVGDVIAFTPPGTPRTYTHRVVAVAADGSLRTKGDVNATPDPWTVRPASVLGRATALVPAAGYLLRAVPVLVVGGALLLLLTAPIRRPDLRSAVRVVGAHLVVTGVLLWMQPLVRVVLVATESAADGVRASVVSTGVLPVRLVTSAGEVLGRLTDGRPRTVTLPSSGPGIERILAVPDLGVVGQLLLVALAVLPALAVLVVGLPRAEPRPAA